MVVICGGRLVAAMREEATLTHAHDPFDDMRARPFAIGYRKGTGEGPVYGGLVAAVLSGFAAAYAGEPRAYVITALALVLAFYSYPQVETGRPQLGANENGLFVAGIGFIAWAEIAHLELFNSSVRQIRLSTLIITLHRPLEAVVSTRENVPWWRLAMARSYRRKGDRRIDVPLHPLQGEPGEVLMRLEAYRPSNR